MVETIEFHDTHQLSNGKVRRLVVTATIRTDFDPTSPDPIYHTVDLDRILLELSSRSQEVAKGLPYTEQYQGSTWLRVQDFDLLTPEELASLKSQALIEMEI